MTASNRNSERRAASIAALPAPPVESRVPSMSNRQMRISYRIVVGTLRVPLPARESGGMQTYLRRYARLTRPWHTGLPARTFLSKRSASSVDFDYSASTLENFTVGL